MGIGKLSLKKIWKYLWKIIGGFVVLYGLIRGIISIINNWDAVSDWLSSIVKPLANPIVRDVLLFVLIVGLSIWLIFVRRRLKKQKEAVEELKRPVPENEKIKGDEFEWTQEHKLLLTSIVGADGEILSEHLYTAYVQEFPDPSKLDFDLYLDDLVEANLIRHPGKAGSSRICIATKEGRRYLNNKRREEKAKEKEEEPKLSEPQYFILALIAESDEERIDFLFVSYKKQFSGANLAEVKHIANLLEKDGLIACAGNIGGKLLYVATDKGIGRVGKDPGLFNKYRKAIEEHVEISKKANEF